MASTASPLAGLTSNFPEPVQVRPRVQQRTVSATLLPTKSTIPRISLVLPASVPEELQYGLREAAKEAVRENVRFVEEGEGPVSGADGWWVWTVL
jgi:hypothetical protein